MKKLLILLVAIGLIAGGIKLFENAYKAMTAPSSGSNTSNSITGADAAISFSDNGFTPLTTDAKIGDSILIRNESSVTLEFVSDPHPSHTDNSDLNVGSISPGLTKLFVVANKGSFGFHNHLNPSQSGRITIN